MTPRNRKVHDKETAARLQRAESASLDFEAQGERVKDQVSLAERLVAGWRRVHERNNLARLFHEEGRI